MNTWLGIPLQHRGRVLVRASESLLRHLLVTARQAEQEWRAGTPPHGTRNLSVYLPGFMQRRAWMEPMDRWQLLEMPAPPAGERVTVSTMLHTGGINPTIGTVVFQQVDAPPGHPGRRMVRLASISLPDLARLVGSLADDRRRESADA